MMRRALSSFRASGQDVRHGARAAAAADGEEGHLDVAALLRALGGLQQPDEIGGLGVVAEDADGLDGGAAHARIRILEAANDHRKGAVRCAAARPG